MAELEKLLSTDSKVEAVKKINAIIEKGGGGGAGLQMFDTILKDHVLTYEESKGLALQGTYVYKEAVAGSRYGYADFYNKCLEEYENSSKQWVKSNVTYVGGVVDNQGVLSGFTQSTYAQIAESLPLSTVTSWDWVFAFTYATSTTKQVIISEYNVNNASRIICVDDVLCADMSTSRTSFNIGSIVGKTTLISGVKYFAKLSFTGSQYNLYLSTSGKFEGEESLEGTVASSTKLLDNTYAIGEDGQPNTNYPFLGSIDLNESYININGERWWNGTDTVIKNPNGHMFYDISIKDEIDELFNTTGVAWMYGIDTENERIFLPRDKYFAIKGSVDTVPVIGNGITLGLTNGSSYGGLFASDNGGMAGALNADSDIYGKPINSGTGDTVGNITRQRGLTITSDPAKSGVIADTSNVVQPNEDKYLYICVGNTEVTSSVTDVVEVTTTENDTTPLFTGMYFDFTPNNVSWLKAGEQKQSGGVYATCYNELVNELTSPKYGLKVINIADMIAGIDYSEYWKVNQDEMTFTTPTAISNKALSGAVVGNGMTLGLSKGESNYGLVCKSGIGFTGSNSAYGKPEASSDSNESLTPGQTYGVSTDPTKSGIIAEQATAQLYFKVANAVQNLELLDVARIEATKANKTDVDGQWVSSALQLTTSTSSGTQIIDLSDYLPNDGYNYEVLINVFVAKNDSTTACVVNIDSDITPNFRVGLANSNGVYSTNTFNLPIGNQRILNVSKSEACNTFDLSVFGYRRLGTNQ